MRRVPSTLLALVIYAPIAVALVVVLSQSTGDKETTHERTGIHRSWGNPDRFGGALRSPVLDSGPTAVPGCCSGGAGGQPLPPADVTASPTLPPSDAPEPALPEPLPTPTAVADPAPLADLEWCAGFADGCCGAAYCIEAQFFEGYRAAGGYYAEAHIARVINCESRWNLYAGGGVHLGLAQFAPGTWASAGGGDWTDAWTQGRNMATWIAAVEADGMSPGSTWGWPVCWWR